MTDAGNPEHRGCMVYQDYSIKDKPESMTQSAPSRIALATSELSARVGRGL